MGKAHAKFVVGELPASRPNPAAECTPEERGQIPSWASQPYDLDEPSDSPPTGLVSRCSPHSAGASAARTGPASFAPLITAAEAATALRVSTKTIRRMIARGELRRVSIGRLIRIRVEVIRQYIRDRTNA
jgi:excisionase family DNA binding protein